jgi:hypothetical protein
MDKSFMTTVVYFDLKKKMVVFKRPKNLWILLRGKFSSGRIYFKQRLPPLAGNKLKKNLRLM